jgi:hypothetical protein
MIQVNNNKYQLLKEGQIVVETEAATFDNAIDYFFEVHPKAYGDERYTFKRVKRPYEY